MGKKRVLFCVLFISAAFLYFGCSDNQNPVSSNSNGAPGKVSMMSKYSGDKVTGINKSGSVQAVDSIEITSARIVLKDVKLEGIEEEHENDGEDNDGTGMNKSECRDEENFKTGPFVLNLNLAGSLQEITVSDVPFGTYKKVKFKIHSVTQSDLDSLSVSDQALFNDFLADGGYSIIIEGNTYLNGTATPFTYKSSLNAVMEIELSPVIIVDENNPAPNITLELSSDGWFKSNDGSLLDPNNPDNSSSIEKNIKNSVHLYKDCDRDGHEDKD